MLKVKDSFDKKTLVNYDFSKKDELGVINYFYNYGYWTLRISNSSVLCVESENVVKMFSFIDVPDEILNKIYELFKADLIEKVESD